MIMRANGVDYWNPRPFSGLPAGHGEGCMRCPKCHGLVFASEGYNCECEAYQCEAYQKEDQDDDVE